MTIIARKNESRHLFFGPNGVFPRIKPRIFRNWESFLRHHENPRAPPQVALVIPSLHDLAADSVSKLSGDLSELLPVTPPQRCNTCFLGRGQAETPRGGAFPTENPSPAPLWKQVGLFDLSLRVLPSKRPLAPDCHEGWSAWLSSAGCGLASGQHGNGRSAEC